MRQSLPPRLRLRPRSTASPRCFRHIVCASVCWHSRESVASAVLVFALAFLFSCAMFHMAHNFVLPMPGSWCDVPWQLVWLSCHTVGAGVVAMELEPWLAWCRHNAPLSLRSNRRHLSSSFFPYSSGARFLMVNGNWCTLLPCNSRLELALLPFSWSCSWRLCAAPSFLLSPLRAVGVSFPPCSLGSHGAVGRLVHGSWCSFVPCSWSWPFCCAGGASWS